MPRTVAAVATLVASSVLAAGLASPGAHADGLKDRKHRVEARISGVHDDLDESSAQVRDAVTALAAARTGLRSARVYLAGTREQLGAASSRDARTEAELTTATARLSRADAALVEGRAKISEQLGTLRQIVVQNYQVGDPSLMGLSMVLTTQDPTDLTGQLNSVQNVAAKQGVVMSDLEASQALLAVQVREVSAARSAVAARRRTAAVGLTRIQRLESQAEAQASSVHALVDSRTRARRKAQRAKVADLAQLRGLRHERSRIAEVLSKRADQARRRAAKAGSHGATVSSGFLDYPVNGPVTSPFGWRIHPIFGYRSLHDGVDFGVACGTPIRAAAAGTVVERYFQTAWGNRVIIDHGFHRGVGLATVTNHMDAPAIVAPGQRVKRGQVVGYVGTTGWSTGCHLHFTVLQNGTAVNPMNWF